MQANVKTALGSEGTLEKQQQTYAEGWEAARARVQTAMEDIYNSLINPDFFKGLDNFFTPFLSTIARVIESMGGLNGVLSTVAVYMNRAFGSQIAQGIQNFAGVLGLAKTQAQRDAENIQAQVQERVKLLEISKNNIPTDQSAHGEMEQFLTLNQEEIKLRGELSIASKNMTDEQKEQVIQQQKHLDYLHEQHDISVQELNTLRQQREETEGILRANLDDTSNGTNFVQNILKRKGVTGLDIDENTTTQDLLNRYQELITNRQADLQMQRELLQADIRNRELRVQDNEEENPNIEAGTRRIIHDQVKEMLKATGESAEEALQRINGQITDCNEQIRYLEQAFDEIFTEEEAQRIKNYGDQLAEVSRRYRGLSDEVVQNINGRNHEDIANIVENFVRRNENQEGFNVWGNRATGYEFAGQLRRYTGEDLFGYLRDEQSRDVSRYAELYNRRRAYEQASTNGERAQALGTDNIDNVTDEYTKLRAELDNVRIRLQAIREIYSETGLGVEDSQLREIMTAVEQINSLQVSMGDWKKELSSLFDNEDINDDFKYIIVGSENAEQAIDLLIKKFKELVRARKTGQDSLRQINSNIQRDEEGQLTDESVKNVKEQLKKDLEKLQKDGLVDKELTKEDIDTTEIEDLEDIIDGLKEKIDQTTKSYEALKKALEGSKGENQPVQVRNFAQQIEDEAGQETENDALAEAREKAMKKAVEIQGKYSTSFGDIAVQAGTAAASVSSFYNGFSGWLKTINSATDGMTALTATITFFTTQAPVVSKLFSDMTTSFSKFNKVRADNSVAGLGMFAGGNFTNLLGGITSGLGIVGTVISAISAAKQEAERLAKEEREKSYKEAETAKTEREANEALIKTYQEQLKTYKETGQGKDELNQTTEKLAKSYDLEGVSIAELTGSYDRYSDILDQIIKKKREQLEVESALAKTAANNAKEDIEKAYENANLPEFKLVYNNDRSQVKLGDQQVASIVNSVFAGSGLLDIKTSTQEITAPYASGNTNTNGITTNIIDTYQLVAKTWEEQMQAYDLFVQTLTKLSEQNLQDSDAYKDISKFISQLQPSIDQLRKSSVQYATTNAEKIDTKDIKTLQEYEGWINKITTDLKASGGYTNASESELSKAISEVNQAVNDSNISNLEKYYNTIQDIRKTTGERINQNDLFNIFESGKYDLDILGAMDWKTVAIQLYDVNGIAKETKITFDDLYKSASDYFRSLTNASSINNFRKNSGSVLDVLSQIGKLDSISDSSLKKVQEGIQQLSQTYTSGLFDLSNLNNLSLYDQIQVVTEHLIMATSSATTEMFEAEKQKQINYYQESKKEAINELNQLEWEKTRSKAQKGVVGWIGGAVEAQQKEKQIIKIEADITDYENKIKEIQDTKLTPIKVEIDDIRLENVIASLNTIKNTTSLIESNGTIAAKNIASAINAIPEIARHADVLADGSLKLNQKYANDVLNRLKNEKQAEQKDLAERLEHRRQYNNDLIDLIDNVTAQENRASNSTKEEAIKNANLSKEQKIAMAKAILIAKLNQALTEKGYSESTTRTVINGENQVANGSADSAMVMAQNYKIASDNIVTNLRNAFVAIKKMETSDDPASVPFKTEVAGGFTSGHASYEASSGPTSTFGGLAKTFIENEGKITTDFLKDLAEYYDMDQQAALAKFGENFAGMVEGLGMKTTGTYYGGDNGFGHPLTIEGLAKAIANGAMTLDQFYENSISGSSDIVRLWDAAREWAVYQLGADTTDLSRLNDAGAATAKKSSGGGGSKSRPKEQETQKKKLKDIEERYHKINRAISQQTNLMDELAKKTDRAYGKDKVELYRKKIEELTKQEENYKTKLREATDDWLVKDYNNLKDTFKDLIDFDMGDEITDLTKLQKFTVDEYNEAMAIYDNRINQYNAMSDDNKKIHEDIKTIVEKDKKAAEELYNNRIEYLQSYEGTLDVIEEQNKNIAEALRQKFDNELKAIDTKLEVIVQVKNMQKVATDLAKAIEESIGDALTHGLKTNRLEQENVQREADMYDDYIDKLTSLQNLLDNTTDATDRQAIIDDIDRLQSQMVASAKDIVDWVGKLEDLVPSALSAAAERFSYFLNQLQHNTTLAGTIKELLTLQNVTYKTADGFRMLQLASQEALDAQVANAQLQHDWYRRSQLLYKEAQEKFEAAQEGTVEWDILKKERDALVQEANKAHEAMLSSAQTAMKTAQEMYKRAIQRAAYEFGKAVTGDNGFDLLKNKFDHFIESEGRYLDKVNEIYQVNSWNNKLDKSIEEATTTAQKERLKALKDELDIRRENNTLSQYDLKILEAKYNLAVAQNALDDAENAKNNLRLVRDRQGNWNYQFTADQDQVDKAKQDVLDAQNEWYNIAKTQTKDLSDQIVSTKKEMADAIQKIYEDWTAGVYADEQEFNAALQETQQFYLDKMKFLYDEQKIAIDDMTEAGELAIEDFDNTYADSLTNMTGNMENFKTSTNTYLDECNNKWNDYNNTVSKVASQTGTTLEELQGKLFDVSDETDKVAEAGHREAEALMDQITQTRDAVHANLELADSLMQVARAYQSAAAAASTTVTKASGYDKKTQTTDKVDDYSGAMVGLIMEGREDLAQVADVYRNEKLAGNKDLQDKYGYINYNWIKEQEQNNTEWWQNTSKTIAKEQADKFKKIYGDEFAFDTGGYTGDFDDAKLAFVHSKELVLNKEDTANILAAVDGIRAIDPDIFRAIESILDTNARASSVIAAQILGGMSPAAANSSLEQHVTIEHVSFPNVTSSQEIELAFMNLVNDAAQYANLRGR